VFGIDAWARRLGIDYVEIRERHSMDPGIWQPLITLIHDRQIDIVHAHDYKTNVLALLLARRTGVIPLATEPGWTGHSPRERWVYYPADKRLARYFPHVLAVSSDIRHELIRHGSRPECVTTLLNGIDPVAFKRDTSRRQAVRAALGVSDSDLLMASVGRLEPQKRFDLLLEAFAGLRAQHPSLRLAIVGDGGERDRLTALSARLGLDGRCLLLGHRTDVADLHNAFDLYVQSSDYEGTPNTVLEAMALETPVVATDAGGTRELAEDGVHALIVPTGDVAALQHAIRAALTDGGATARRASAARARIETTLSFQARTAHLNELYAELTARLRPLPRVAPHRAA
jgi:glycosyltransferase involved in cell wall biosynthesis